MTKRSHQQRVTFRGTFDQLRRRYCGWSTRSARSVSSDLVCAYCSGQSCTMSRLGEEPGSCTISSVRDTLDVHIPQIARRVEGSNSRENLDSEICGGLQQLVGDVGHTFTKMHLASGTQARPVDLTLQIVKRRSKRSEGGAEVDPRGKVLGQCHRRMVGSVLIRKAREEEM